MGISNLLMKLLLNNKQYKNSGIFFGEKKTNMIMDGEFSKIIYSDKHFSLNGLFFVFPLKVKQIVKNNLYFELKLNIDIFNILHKIEEELLNSYASYFQLHGKTKILSFKNISLCGYVKFYQEKNAYKQNINYDEKFNYYIKISGIWESSFKYGITYKIIEY